MTNSLAIAAILYLGVVFLFVYGFDWGFLGICWATTIHLILRFVIAHAFVMCNSQLKEANTAAFFSKATFEKLGH